MTQNVDLSVKPEELAIGFYYMYTEEPWGMFAAQYCGQDEGGKYVFEFSQPVKCGEMKGDMKVRLSKEQVQTMVAKTV